MLHRLAAAALLLASCATTHPGPAPKAPRPRLAPPPDPRFVFYPPDVLPALKSIHAFQGKPVCQACHVGATPQLIEGLDRTCARCHSYEHDDAHKAGNVMDPKRVGNLPIPGGRLACHTCHDPHDVKRFPYGLLMKHQALCLTCHPGK